MSEESRGFDHGKRAKGKRAKGWLREHLATAMPESLAALTVATGLLAITGSVANAGHAGQSGSPSAEQVDYRSSIKSPLNPFQLFRDRMAQIGPQPGTEVAREDVYVENAWGDCEGIGDVQKFYVNVNNRYRNRVTVTVVRRPAGYSQRITEQPEGYLNIACDNVEESEQRLEAWTPAQNKSAESAVNGYKRVWGSLSSRVLPERPEYVVDDWASPLEGNRPPTERRDTRTLFTNKRFTDKALKNGELVIALRSESHGAPVVLSYFGAVKGQDGEGSASLMFTKPVRTKERVPRANHHDAVPIPMS